MYGLFYNQAAQAGTSCPKTDLYARGYNGNLFGPTYNAFYDIPACHAANGFKVTKVWIRGSAIIGVKFEQK